MDGMDLAQVGVEDRGLVRGRGYQWIEWSARERPSERSRSHG
eukprot:COSAG02_NODE_47946_length_337_cov_1.079832_1_plen_41_part_10